MQSDALVQQKTSIKTSLSDFGRAEEACWGFKTCALNSLEMFWDISVDSDVVCGEIVSNLISSASEKEFSEEERNGCKHEISKPVQT